MCDINAVGRNAAQKKDATSDFWKWLSEEVPKGESARI
jgi:hypothetical protein